MHRKLRSAREINGPLSSSSSITSLPLRQVGGPRAYKKATLSESRCGKKPGAGMITIVHNSGRGC
jgi:hypothetical protein